eukprot:3254482-Rhodomonas_salina.2
MVSPRALGPDALYHYGVHLLRALTWRMGCEGGVRGVSGAEVLCGATGHASGGYLPPHPP